MLQIITKKRSLGRRALSSFGLARSLRPGQRKFLFFFNDTPPTEIYTPLYTLSLHDALPISSAAASAARAGAQFGIQSPANFKNRSEEHTSELQSHSGISYAVFCLKKKK